jgi:hypothetical protein
MTLNELAERCYREGKSMTFKRYGDIYLKVVLE